MEISLNVTIKVKTPNLDNVWFWEQKLTSSKWSLQSHPMSYWARNLLGAYDDKKPVECNWRQSLLEKEFIKCTSLLCAP